MPHIQQLDPHVADLIAAGEVVERPASVVKELMENAIDAGADTLTVEIQHGGMSLIRVTDNGCGIACDEAPTAFLRHATSKLRTEYDLEAIGTLGFRGEALAAISAVSRVELLTRTAEEELGAALSLEGGTVVSREEAGCPQGTTLVVRDLFYNTPARLKFMKKDAAEGAACFAMVQRVALSHPEVSVKFLRDGKQELLTPGDGQLQSALYAVLGRDMALGYKAVKGSGEDMAVTGFVTLPTCCRGTRGYQHFFVNGRYVKSRTMMAALEEAYANQKMVGRFPGCVLHLQTKLNAVDVNVHPTKQEVKFGSDKKVFDAVYYAVKSTLEGDHTRPALTLDDGKPARPAAPPVGADIIRPQNPEPRRAEALPLRDFTAPVRNGIAPRRGGLWPPAGEGAPVSDRMTGTGKPADSGRPQAAPTEPEGSGPIRIPAPVRETPSPPSVTAGRPDVRPLQQEDAPDSPAGAAPAQSAAPDGGSVPAPEPVPEPEPWRMAGEVLNTYIVVEQGDKVLFIDKHAAHERLNFDRLKAEGYQPMVQALLEPVVFTPPAEEGAALLAQLPLLERFGFEAEDFGGGTLIVRAAPSDVAAGEIPDVLGELAGKLLTGGSADPDAARDALLHTMACKAAIKGGQRNSPGELYKVAEAVMSGAVKYCPHGRPVAIELTRQQLEKRFGRA
ncbi:DNA mismatch repair endonuclease MutL [uncultured Flavonifractor sp.]|uniref:DNA mismatch repair endonuclease MutL n=1 Tax=uncultured Flavonifractor sp. TaxID=1193534 RepID=UPI00174DEA46|nr:DNA mismatch repair endonuclease MutL [uncultured Flavonifractor sp.]